jgi:hypothetical protein
MILSAMLASISSKFIKGLGIFYGIDDKVVYHKLRYIFNGIGDKIARQKLRMSMDFLMEVGRSNLIFWYEYYMKEEVVDGNINKKQISHE